VSRNDYFLDPRAVRRSFDRASATFDAASVVHAEIRNRLLERLDVVRLEPAVVLDLGCATGHVSRALGRRYRRAQIVALDFSTRMLAQARHQQPFWHPFERVAGDARALPLGTASVDLVASNLMLQWCDEPDAVLAEVRRVLRRPGLFTFTTLGPDTLKELRAAWRESDDAPHVHAFIDMHDLGDALMRAGFAEPVMDTERLTITYRSLDALLRELKASGSHNALATRRRGLTTRAQLTKLQHAAQSRMRGDVMPVSIEVVYGHAWAGEPRRPREAGGEVRIPLTALKGGRPRA
jgi:malonyl-CoA O-methyltransferase